MTSHSIPRSAYQQYRVLVTVVYDVLTCRYSSEVFLFCKLFMITPKSTFLSVCRPVQPMMDQLWRAVPEFQRTSRMFFDVSICQGMTSEVTTHGDRYWEIHNALTAFPSGRVATVWLCGWFLSIYWNAKLRPFANRRTATLWRILLVFLPLTIAMAMTAIFISQHVSRYHDCRAGAFADMGHRIRRG